MISIRENIKDVNAYAWEAVWFVLKPLIIIGIICVPLTIFFLSIENLPSKGPLGYGYMLLVVVVVVILLVARMYFYYKKTLKLFFRDADMNGDIELTILFDNEEYVIENLANKTVSRLKKADIKKMKVLKKCVFIKTMANQVIFFPKTDDLIRLLR